MIDIKSITFENNGNSLIICVSNKSKITYDDISIIVSNDIIIKYLDSLFSIIDSWKDEYINTNIIDGNSWHLTIIYANNNKKEYYGKSQYPNNFEALKRLNQDLIDEVRHGKF